MTHQDWRDDPAADERWSAGLDYAMTQLCELLGVDQNAVTWDAATETLDGDVRAVLGNILRAKYGENWGPRDDAVNSLPALVKALEAARKFIADEYRDPAAEVDGHWLSSEARPVFDEICDALGSNPNGGLHGPYGWLIKPAGLNEEHWYLSSDPSSGADGEISVPLYATEEQELGALASHKTGG